MKHRKLKAAGTIGTCISRPIGIGAAKVPKSILVQMK
jgi:hypothetical protein